MTLIGRRADYRITTGAHSCLTGIGLRTRVAVIARRTIALVGKRAGAVAVTRAGLVTLIGSCAREGRARARTVGANVAVRTRVAVVARRTIGLVGKRAGAVAIARA